MNHIKQQLKAERVQEPEAAALMVRSVPKTALKMEQVKGLLKDMPGWKLILENQALGRVREFAIPAHAEAFAGYVAKLALAERLPVTLKLTPSQVIVTVHGVPQNGRAAALTDEVIALADAIG